MAGNVRRGAVGRHGEGLENGLKVV